LTDINITISPLGEAIISIALHVNSGTHRHREALKDPLRDPPSDHLSDACLQEVNLSGKVQHDRISQYKGLVIQLGIMACASGREMRHKYVWYLDPVLFVLEKGM
jgi:hypothetical protein